MSWASWTGSSWRTALFSMTISSFDEHVEAVAGVDVGVLVADGHGLLALDRQALVAELPLEGALVGTIPRDRGRGGGGPRWRRR